MSSTQIGARPVLPLKDLFLGHVILDGKYCPNVLTPYRVLTDILMRRWNMDTEVFECLIVITPIVRHNGTLHKEAQR